MAMVLRDLGKGKEPVLIWWSELTRAEKVRATYLRVTGAVAAISFLAMPGIRGENDKQLPRTTQEETLISAAKGEYDSASIGRKFSVGFISPIRQRAEQNNIEGNGWAELAPDDFSYAHVRVGRSCLKGTAYDTTSYKSEASAVAALSVNDSTVTVHAAGSEALPLQFTVSSVGNLSPSPETKDTLRAYGCRYLGDLPVRTAFAQGSDELEWQYAGRLQEVADQ